MRRILFARLVSGLAIAISSGAPILASSAGSGAPTLQIQLSFNAAYTRGQFASLVLQPTADVRPYGATGLIQEFTSRLSNTVRYALVMPDQTLSFDLQQTWQISGDLYTYYTSTGLGLSAVGYPNMDTTPCPANTFGTCNYQLFSKNYGLFVYSSPSVNFQVKDPFFTQFMNGGGAAVFGPAIAAENTATSVSTVIANQQAFATGVVFSYPSTSTTPSSFGVGGAFFSSYNSAGGLMTLGFPTSNPFQVNGGLTRQTFEFGRLELPSGATTPVVIFGISQLGIIGAQRGLTLTLGNTATLSASVIDATGMPVTGRALTWSTSNGAVAVVMGNGDTAVVRAVGGGTANIYLSGEGKTSQPIVVKVPSVCCAVGEGAPSSAVSQAFQTAVSRNKLNVLLPSATPVTRAGAGFVQMLQSPDGATLYVIAQADNSSTAWLLTGDLYAAYVAGGGFLGPLGYPVSDPMTGGVQKFSSGAVLAGSPVVVIAAPVALKWSQLGGLAGGAGTPLAVAVPFQSASANGGISQSFANGSIFAITAGSAAGKAWFSTGLILARYLQLSGPAGALGVPTSDITGAGTTLSQNFEAGYIDLQAGAAAAVEHFFPRHPAVSITPSTVIPGGRVHINVTGFVPSATLAFTVTGQPGFSVQTATGAFQWDVVIPPGAKSATVSVQATAQGGTDVASASYSIMPTAALLPRLTIVSGDRQTALPGSALPLPVVAVLRDSGGNPIAGVPVSWSVSPGASIQSGAATDSTGSVALIFRLPATAGVAVGALSAGGQTATFSALAAASSIANFPAFPQDAQQSAFVTSLAAMLRYYQNQSAVPSPNGLATPTTLNAFLAAANAFQLSETGVSIANPWVAARFAKAGLWLEPPTLDRVHDLLAAGMPLLLVLNLSVDGVNSGSTSVAAIGANSDGSVAISDPNLAFARTSLADYLAGFDVQGHTLQGSVAAVLRFGPPQLPAGAMPFVVGSQLSEAVAVSSPFGACVPLDLPDPVAGGQPPTTPGGVRYQYCDGMQAAYEADFGAARGAVLTDLTGAGNAQIPADASTGWAITRSTAAGGGGLVVAAQALTIDAVVDSAAFGPQLAPGGLISIFGSGLSSGSAGPTVTLGTTPLRVLAAFPFQINAALLATAAPGSAVLTVTGPLGSATKSVTLSAVAPGIFVLGTGADAKPKGAIVNQDGTINDASSPAQRGQFVSIYCAGLGATSLRAGLQATNAPVSVLLNGVTLTPSFAGLAPGFVGLYQVNVTVPPGLPPGLGGSLLLRSGSQSSNTVGFVLQ